MTVTLVEEDGLFTIPSIFLIVFRNWKKSKDDKIISQICVKILEGWGKLCGRPHRFVKLSCFGVNSTNCYDFFLYTTIS